jgi:hypothetical protein
MLEAAFHIENKQDKKATQEHEHASKNEKSLFIHLKFHPHDIGRKAIRRIYNETLQGQDIFDAMNICYSRQQ